MEKNKTSLSVYKICVTALAICINLIGGQIALLFHLPVYLDSIGTFFVSATLGPLWGMLPNFLGGLIMGMTTDIYSLYYAPVGILLGLVAGFVFKRFQPKKWDIIPVALLVTIPTTIVSAGITAFLFGGITSSGSTILVQLLAKTPIGLTGACFIVQFITDYADRLIGIFLAMQMIRILPRSIMEKLK